MNVDLSTPFALQMRDGLSRLAAVESLILRGSNSLGADPGEMLDYFSASIYLRLFGEWENFLEQVTTLSLAGRAPAEIAGRYAPISPAASVPDAAEALLGGQDYLLWHNPGKVEARLSRHFVRCALLDVLHANHDAIEWYAAIRHAIAHRSRDAQQKFEERARTNLARGFRAGPGRVLRSRAPDSSATWLSVIVEGFESMAYQAWPASA